MLNYQQPNKKSKTDERYFAVKVGAGRMNQDRIPVVQTDPLADKIQERNNKSGKEHDPIKPAHYRKRQKRLTCSNRGTERIL